MDDKVKLALFVLGGYVLGRTRKMKLALTVAGAIAGNRLRDESSRAALLGGIGEVKDTVMSAPEVKRLTDEVTGKLVNAGRTAALAAAGKGVASINSVLESQTERLRSMQPTDALPLDEEEPAEEKRQKPAKEEGKPASRTRKTQQKQSGEEEKPKKSARASSSRASSSRGSTTTRSSTARPRKSASSRSAS